MDYPFLNTNLQILAGQHAPIVQWIKQQKPEFALSKNIMTNPWGTLDWEFKKGTGLFQTLPPAKAYQSWHAAGAQATGASLVVGSNLGYGLHFLLERTADTHRVMLLEPRPEMLLAALGLTDFSSVLKQGRLTLIPPEQTLLQKMVYQLTLACLFGQVVLRPDLPSRQLGPEYDLWTRYGREALEDMRVELHTLRLRQDRMMRNELDNLARASEEKSLLALKGRAAGLKAVLLGAGPSLEQFAPRLATDPGQALYITSLQTLPALQRLGLKPHLCLALECEPYLEQVYKNLDPDWVRDVPLIYALSVSPAVVKAYPGPTIPLWPQGGMAACLLVDPEVLIEPGGNVASTMLRFLDWCGADQVMLVGHDFAWQGEKTHAQNHWAAEDDFLFDPAHHLKIKNKAGASIYSNPGYLTALRTLEADLGHLKMPVYNLYGGGALIQGSRPLTWDEVVTQSHLQGRAETRERFLKQLQTSTCPPIRFKMPAGSSKWMDSLKDLKKRLKKLFQQQVPDPKTVKTVLNRALGFMEQDPFIKPLLFNEMLDLAGLIHVSRRFSDRECKQSQKIIMKMMEKLEDLDKRITPFRRIQGA
jgi:hypothetical protein